MAVVPIASLSPHVTPQTDTSIRAIVTLSWPYSSSTQQCALLLADPDFRLRKHQGQIRVRFTGPSAKAVANSRVHIGDEVVLKLGGAKWAEAVEVMRTPGKSVDGELVYHRRLALKITSPDRQDFELAIDTASPTHLPKRASDHCEKQTPAPRGVTWTRMSLDSAEGIYPSPVFVKRSSLSEQILFDPVHELFADDPLDIEHIQKKIRKSWRGNTLWRYAERSPSPSKFPMENHVRPSPQPLPALQSQSTAESPELPMSRQIDGAHDDETLVPDREASSYTLKNPSIASSDGHGASSHETLNIDALEKYAACSAREVWQHATSVPAEPFIAATKFVVAQTISVMAEEVESRIKPPGAVFHTQSEPDLRSMRKGRQSSLSEIMSQDLEAGKG